MKLIEDLFKIETVVFCEVTESTALQFSVALKPVMDSVIFKAHFPDKPVIPGACLVGAAVELVSKHVDPDWKLANVKNVKFTSLIEPTEETTIWMYFDVDKWESKIKVQVMQNDSIACKMSLVCDTAL